MTGNRSRKNRRADARVDQLEALVRQLAQKVKELEERVSSIEADLDRTILIVEGSNR